MAEDFIVSTIPILSILIGVSTLGGAIYKVGVWINKKAEQKAEALRLVTERKADELKEYAIKAAKEVEIKTDGQVDDLRRRLDKITETLVSLKLLEEKVDRLNTRADLTNGNVSNIRTDIADVKQDLLALYDTGGRTKTANRARKKIELLRREKARGVERDRIEQSEEIGRGGSNT